MDYLSPLIISKSSSLVWKPITSSIFSPSSPKQTISQPQLSITTPPRTSLKRQIICNDSPIISPSKIISISQPTFVTPVKKQIHNTKSIEVSPTKVQTDIEVIEENNTIILSSKVKRLLKEQEEERNQFRRLMKRQITAIQNNFEFGLSHWNNVWITRKSLWIERSSSKTRRLSEAICIVYDMKIDV